ncbi:2054_t:CDS:2 [Gigaspora margarita]|uniref:2054_t:CDS:1 n=1 Tax=Gigaspora margarita TaxID=4874 RepID=A0ABN7UAG6_GIGMA|nr:2054_t:CDS:2 [Gigaspora margarita]
MSTVVIKSSNILPTEYHVARLNYPLNNKMQQLNMAPAIQPSSITTVRQSTINNCSEPEVDCIDDSLHEDESQLTPDSPKSGILPHFEYVSYDRVQDLYEQRKGHFYFIPDGFEPVLVPNDSKASAVTNLLENSKPVSSAPNVSRMLPDSDVRLPSFALPCGVAGSKTERSANGKNSKVKKPPRPPNAFILYRRAKQPQIVAQHQGISNNDVSKEIGRMWHEEPLEVRLKFQKMAEAAKEEHMKKYPEYRYRPRRPQERKRRIPAAARDASTRRVSAPGLPHNLLVDTSSKASGSRRISSGLNDSDGYLSDSQIMTMQNQQSFRTNNGDFENHMFYASPTNTSQQETFGYIENSMPQQFSYVQNSYDNCSTDFASFDVDFDDYDYNGQMASLEYPMNDQYSQY